ncbi:hypothetical protein H9Y04_40690 [Streptomyces sp. TRM66268-LWL]|uniref:Uncharacterized protein n=1 Tax=Streptomyces polyasparticus TaxID=2767826 RepID=A0ABR7STQ0_9ACTN|nr:hypothetical protein [Streptomyces polyasparticus]MBC9718865.1 hypothetical protein [Streptomyces polyasparticus]
MVLRNPVSDAVLVRSVVAVRQRWHLAEPDARGVLWWCGDQTGGGVLVRPDGDGLLWARAVGSARLRRESRAAWESGRLSRDGVVQPAAAAPQPSVADCGQPLDTSSSRGPFRWRMFTALALAGLALFGVCLAAEISTDSDPYVPLIVESGPSSDGRCVASWREQDTDVEHFVDLPCTERLIDAPDEYGFRYMDGWTIAHGPFKGDLYNADLEGTDAFAAYTGGLVAGGVLLLGSAGALVLSWVSAARHRNAISGLAPRVSPEIQPRVSLVKAHSEEQRYGWAELSAAAAEQARSHLNTPGDGAPVASDAGAPWWRIKPLLEIAGIRHLSVSTLAFVGVGVVFLFIGNGSWIIVGITCGTFLVAVAQTVRAARTARRLAQDAAVEPQQTGRYVLLREYATRAPWAVYFSIGDDDTPFAAQPLLANQVLPGPSGEVRLHGTAEHLDIRVPWMEGRPVWPAGDYILLGTDPVDDRAFFDALTAD